MKIKYLILLVISMMSLSACQPTMNYIGDPELPYPPERQPVIGDILHLQTGLYVDQQTMLDQATRVRVIFVGETHDNPASHRLQEEILNALQQHNPDNISLAMEMFTPSQQSVLDRWVAGELTEKEFLKQVGWYSTWHMNFGFYRNLLTFCRDNQIPILALNSEKEIKKTVSRTPFEQLSEEEKSLLPQMDHSDPYQKTMVKAVFSGHKMGKAMVDGFQRVQTLWDETMAENLANYLRSKEQDHQVLVIAGGNHVRYGFGIPRRMFRRVPSSYILIGSTELNIPEDKQDRLMDITKPNYPMTPYHFLTFTEYEDLPSPGVKLGIALDKAEGGLVIKKVMPGSVAEQNALLENDLLTQIDMQELKEPFDLIYELQQKAGGDKIELTLSRDGKSQTKQITFPAQSEKP
jgi:uncharacterized iron-regulated protein